MKVFHQKLSMRLSLFIAGVLLPLLPVKSASLEEGTVRAHWLFASHRQQGQKMLPIQGGPRPIFRGQVRFETDPLPPRVELTGNGERLVLAEKIEDASLPEGSFSVETWLKINELSPKAGIIGAVQDDASAKAGWILGHRNEHFFFGLASEKGQGMTYIQSKAPFMVGKWHHVVASFSGDRMELWLDGNQVAQSDAQNGKVRYPDNLTYEIGAFHDADEHHALVGAIHEIYLLDGAMGSGLIQARYRDKRDYFPKPGPDPVIMPVAYGPFIDWQGKGKVRISWEVDASMPTRIDLMGPEGEFRQFSVPMDSRKHEVVFDQLQRDAEYQFRIHGPDAGERAQFTKLYEFDTSFYYAPVQTSDPEAGSGLAQTFSKYESSMSGLLNATGRERGFGLILGAGDREQSMAFALAHLSEYKLVLVDPSEKKVQSARQALDEAGVYGERVTVHQGDYSSLPYGTFFANLILVPDAALVTKDQAGDLNWLKRMVRPAGGTICVAVTADTPFSEVKSVSDALSDFQVNVRKGAEQSWVMAKRGELVGAGEWSHQYGGADNSSCSQDALVHGELGVLWWGDPGPRPMPDRGPRNPAPVSVNGRLFIQGDRTLFGVDSYNGTILWNYFSPEMRRSNMPRDCSNMIGTHDYLYIAQGRYCIGIEGDTGERKLRFEVMRPEGSPQVDWGYMATVKDMLIGSSVKSGGGYLGDDGEWFEEYHPEDVSRVVSNGLFGLNRHSGEQVWSYQGGAIINSTITIGNGEIYFLESLNPEAMASTSGRLEPEVLTEVRLVCLDLESGQQQWERVHDFSSCQFMTYMSFSNDTLVVTGADKNKHYHTFAFNTATQEVKGDLNQAPMAAGSLLWEESHEAGKNHHSGHLQHPVVIGDTFYSDQRAFSLRDGKLLRTDLPERRGCGTMSAALNSIFYRHYYHGQWDLETDKRVQFEGLRSGCWLGMIPAGGLLLAPEASAGCSCANAIQTSVGYVPKHLDPAGFTKTQIP